MTVCRLPWRNGFALLGVATSALLSGCAPKSRIYDPDAITKARRVAVLPAVSAPGPDGVTAGPVQASLLIGSLANAGRFRVEGPGRLRRAFAQEAGAREWSSTLQADLAMKLGLDVLVLCEIGDYRYTKKTSSSWFVVGSSERTESTYWVSAAVRLVDPRTGKLLYSGQGEASSQQGYGPALAAATEAALAELKQFLAKLRT